MIQGTSHINDLAKASFKKIAPFWPLKNLIAVNPLQGLEDERQALIELTGRLAPIDRGPINVIGHLSRDDDIEISGPILEQSNMLTDNDLVEIATTKSQAHLSTIAGRKRIGEPVTDARAIGAISVCRNVRHLSCTTRSCASRPEMMYQLQQWSS